MISEQFILLISSLNVNEVTPQGFVQYLCQQNVLFFYRSLNNGSVKQ